MNGTLPATTVNAWLTACRKLGIDIHAVLRGAGLSPRKLSDPEAPIPRTAAAKVWTLSYEHSDDPDLALHAAEEIDHGAYKVIDFLSSNAPTVGIALERIAEYFPLIDDLVKLESIVEKETVRYRMSAPSPCSTSQR